MTVDLTRWFSPEQIEQLEPLLAKAKAEGWAEWIKTRSDYAAVLQGCYFDNAKAEHFRTFCRSFIRNFDGQWAGKPFELFDWQWRDVVGPLFGWMTADGTRRFRRAYVTVAKKAGKSGLAAAVQLYMLCGDGEQGARCFCAALTRDQAKEVWGAAAAYVSKSPKLRERLKVVPTTGRIAYYKNNAYLSALSADKDSAEGKNSHCVVYDELHMAKTDTFFDILCYSTIARPQSLFLIITTAGDDTASICHKQYSYAKKVLDGTVEDITFLPCIYEAPLDADMSKIETGRLANPSLGITIPESVYLTAHKEAVATGKIANFRRRMLNQWIKDETHWIQPHRWEACRHDFDAKLEKQLEDLPCWLGVDMSCCDDFTALVKVWRDDDSGEHFVKARFWLPEPTFRERVQKGLGALQQWQLDGWVELIDAPAIEPDEIEAAIRQECDSNPQIKEIAFDMAMAKSIISHLDRDGYKAVGVGQSTMSLNLPMRTVERLVLNKLLVHDGNPCLAWMVSNCVPYREKANNNMRPSKGSSPEKIDGVSALVTAMARVVLQSEEESPYDKPQSERVVFL